MSDAAPPLPQETIARKRDGRALAAAEIASFVAGIAGGRVTDAQIAAFAMAVLWRGLTLDERVALTRAMATSGTRLAWNLPGPVIDKHSTGGVGDKVSLILAPLAAACGLYVPMIAGRGLGHTGGTIDKLEAIAGYRTRPDLAEFRRAVRSTGCAIVGATPDLAPADARIYAVRDTTATVESLDLITASILSKKLAAGLQGLVMDVKVGSGAFLPDPEAARDLAEALAQVAAGAGLPTRCLLTDMDQCLGRMAGNALEVREALALLRDGDGDGRLLEVTLALAGEMLAQGGLAADPEAGVAQAREALADGRAAERFGRMVAALGGPADLVETNGASLPAAPIVREVHATDAGSVAAIDVRALGWAIVALGGGRARPQDPVDPSVGLAAVAALGERVGPGGRPLCLIHAAREDDAAQAEARIRAAFRIGDPPPAAPILRGRVGG